MAQITYGNKVALYENTDIADINKVKADDMNEIKASVNNNDDMLNGNAIAGNMIVESIRTSNILPYSDLGTQTQNGITIINNNDGTYTVNGTAIADISLAINNNFIPLSGTWRMQGCPSGGSSSTYMLSAFVGHWGTGSPNIDIGNGTNITYTGNVKIRFYIKSGTTCNNLLFKPMITYDTTATRFSAYQNLNSHDNIYSTNETIIGTWIDGKPIYRKVYQFTTPSTENSWMPLGATGVNIGTIVDFRGTVFETGQRKYNSINFGEGSYYIHTAVYAGNNRGIEMIQKGWSSLPCVIIIEYTKATD